MNLKIQPPADAAGGFFTGFNNSKQAGGVMENGKYDEETGYRR